MGREVMDAAAQSLTVFAIVGGVGKSPLDGRANSNLLLFATRPPQRFRFWGGDDALDLDFPIQVSSLWPCPVQRVGV